jgi:hypothetical protein
MAELWLFLNQLFDVISGVGEAGAITRRDLSPQRQPRYMPSREAEHKRRASLETRE